MPYRNSLIFSVLCLSLSLSACKVVINVPEQGRVASQSGVYDCEAGTTCEIDVVDLFFEDVFEAQPADGYFFLKWRKTSQHLCGNSSEACTVSSAVLESYPALMFFLETERRFPLEPLFVEDNLIDADADSCYSNLLFVPGTVISTAQRHQIGDQEIETLVTQTIEEKVRENGKKLVKSVADVESTSGTNLNSVSRTISYHSFNSKQMRYKLQSTRRVAVEPESPIVVSYSYGNGQLNRLDMSPGESYTQTYGVERLSENSSTQSSGVINSVEKRTQTYLGMEKISIPAGKFKACKFLEETVRKVDAGQSETLRYYWVGKENGLVLKYSGDVGEMEVISAEVNGESI